MLLDLFNELYAEFLAYNLYEVLAVITALIYVWLASKENKWCFLFGLISSLIFIKITLEAKLYFDSLINAYYIIMSFYGWIAWSKSAGKKNEIEVVKASTKKLLITIVMGLTIAISLAYLADNYTDAHYAYPDAFTTVFSIIATYWVVQKFLENWLIWLVVDLVATIMYYNKELYFTALLFAIYTIISIYGYYNWKSKQKISIK